MKDLFANYDIEVVDGSLKDGALTPDDGKRMKVKFIPKDNKIDLINDLETEVDFGLIVGFTNKGYAAEMGIATNYNDEETKLFYIKSEFDKTKDNGVGNVSLVYTVNGEFTASPAITPYTIHEINAHGLFRDKAGFGVKMNELETRLMCTAFTIPYEDAYYFIETDYPILAAYMGALKNKTKTFANYIVTKPNYFVKDTNE